MNTEQFDGHTPGPWVAKFDEHGVEGSLVVEGNSNDGEFGSCASPLWVGESDKNMPDARLIAAAPDLLAEVKRLRRLNNYLWEHRSSHWSADDDAEMDRLEMIE